MTVLKALALLDEMDGNHKQTVGKAIRERVRIALKQEVARKIAEAVDLASDAGMTDEEIVEYVRGALRQKKRVREQLIANALKYRASASRKTDCSDRSS